METNRTLGSGLTLRATPSIKILNGCGRKGPWGAQPRALFVKICSPVDRRPALTIEFFLTSPAVRPQRKSHNWEPAMKSLGKVCSVGLPCDLKLSVVRIPESRLQCEPTRRERSQFLILCGSSVVSQGLRIRGTTIQKTDHFQINCYLAQGK